MDQKTFLTARQIALDSLGSLGTAFDIDPRAARKTLIEAGTPEKLGLTYLAPFDIGAVPDASLDLVISRACLEDIPVADLEILVSKLRPKLKHNGFMVHAIDNSDHFSHIDPTISRINFLTWSEAKHRLISKLGKGGENGLRHHEYADLFRRMGYAVMGAEAYIHDKALQDASALNIAVPYDQMTAEQIAATTSWYVLRVG